VTHPLWLRCVAEGVGTALLVGIGTGAIVAGANAGGVPQWVLAVAWFLAVLVPILAFASVSGAHINPAVTLTLTLSGRFPRREAVPYAAAQVLGAFAGSATVAVALGPGGHLGATVPTQIGVVELFALEFAFTLLLILAVLYLTRPRDTIPVWELVLPAAVVGLSTFLIGPLTGSSLNPARSLAPAVLSATYSSLLVYFGAAAAAALCASLALWAGTRVRTPAGPLPSRAPPAVAHRPAAEAGERRGPTAD
jgi:glycerol uptake facilitator-like aquaporin